MKDHLPKNQQKMNTQHRSPAQAGSLYEVPPVCKSITETQTRTDGNDSTFIIVDSTEMQLSSLMSPARKEDVSILYIEKGEVTLVHDMKTYTLSKGMILYKVPQVTVRLLSFSKDCQFKVFCFAPQFAIAGNMPITHLETMTVIASNNPVLILDTLTAATVTVLFWLLKKKVYWEENAPSPDDTIQHVFSLLMLEIICSYKKNTAANCIM